MTRSHSEPADGTVPTALLTTKQVATLLGLHTETVRDLVRAGKLKDLRMGHRTRRYRPEDVAAYQLAAADAVAENIKESAQ